MQAYATVKAGIHDVVLVVGAEKMNYPERRKEMFEAFKGSWDRDLADKTRQRRVPFADLETRALWSDNKRPAPPKSGKSQNIPGSPSTPSRRSPG